MTEIKSFVFFDLETTGLPEYEHFKTKITELSMVACSREHLLECVNELPRVLHKLSLCFNPSRLITVGASQATGLYNDLLEKEGKFDGSAGEMVKHFLDRLQKPVCLVAHNGNRFDFILLKQHMLRIGVMLPSFLYVVDSLPAFREIEADVEKSYFESNEGLDSEIPDLEYQTICIMEELERANDGLKDRQRINETTPRSAQVERKYKQTLREYLNVTPEGTASPTERDIPASRTGNARKRLFNDAFDNKTSSSETEGSPRGVKKRYNLAEIYKRTVGKELVAAHRAEEDVLALMNCAAVHAVRFVRYVEANCVSYEEVKSKF
ncbi:AGAP006662-PA-like protein [Anopheles sinensis]|uniref:AGAP006662-PA-like protein n=1 Tax=Anopheles sinensis TaxID=74873 RepID=A0A084WK02_ANOSI|nr:AGAP006662-PA-like protein [Anopheles sinensis]